VEELQSFTKCGKAWAEETANMAIAIIEQNRGGGIDELDYQDMIIRLVEGGDLDAKADDLDLKANLVNAIYSEAGII